MSQLQQMATTPQHGTQSTSSSLTAEPQSYTAFTIPADNSGSGADDFFGTAQSSSGFQQPQMSADLTNDMGWAGLDWSTFAATDNAQPALTYASSNTISELGEHTPPDEFGAMFVTNNVPSNLTETSAQLARIPESQPAFEPQVNRQSDNQQNRWSLPPSFWADSANFMNLNPPAPTSTAAMDISKVGQDVRTKDFGFNDWASSFVPSTTSAQSFSTNDQATWSPDAATQQAFDFQSIPGSSDVNMNTFDFGNDSSNATFRQTPEDPFFGLESAEPLDFNQDFSQNDLRENWPS
ncbi:Hypothetical protein D9617_32g092060 [Elsinoe fawcettii]|nr:Hypothetical protein D9617_32g092060 [Elsinoe fawcettii]